MIEHRCDILPRLSCFHNGPVYMYVFIALFLTLFYALGVFCSGKCFSPDIFIVSVRHFKGKRVVGWLGGWVGNWGNWARGGEAAATHLCARQVGALSL